MDLHRLRGTRALATALVAATTVVAAGPASATEPHTTLDVLSIVDGEHVVESVTVPSRRAGTTQAALADDPAVLAVDVQVTYQVDEADPYWDEQDPIGVAHAREAWKVTRGAGQIVAVLDTGIDPDHEDLAGALLPLEDVIGGVGDPWHGTGVAGVVAAQADNGLGGAGIAPEATVLPVRVCNDLGCPSTAVAKGILYAADHGADVINLSLSGRDYSWVTATAVLYALDRGISVVASAGNDGLKGNPVMYPAANSGVIAVGALKSDSTPADWSVHGWQVDISTVGDSVLLPTPGDGYGNGSGTSFSGPAVAGAVALVRASHPGIGPEAIQAALQASSDSAGAWDRSYGAGRLDIPAALAAADRAHGVTVTGGTDAVDVSWAPHPGATSYLVRVDGTVRTEVAGTRATVTGLTAGTQVAVDVQPSNGVRTQARLAHVGRPAPGVVTLHEGKMTTSGMGSPDLHLRASIDGTPGERYVLLRNGVSRGMVSLNLSSVPSWAGISLGSLPAEESVWQLQAVDSLGRTAAASNPIRLGTGTPEPPGAITGLSAAVHGERVFLTWDQLAEDSGYEVVVAGVVVQTAKSGGAVVPAPGAGQTRRYSVRAVDVWGQHGSAASVDVVMDPLPVRLPTAPTSVAATRGEQYSATVSWTAPADDGGSPVTGYSVTATPGGRTVVTTGGATSATVDGLHTGLPYTFTVRAINSLGAGPESAPTGSILVAGSPSAPTAVTAQSSDGGADVSWTPAPDNGDPITGYTVTASPGGVVVTTTGATSATVPGLTNGTAYTFTVTATNAVGTSAASAPSRPVTPTGPARTPDLITLAPVRVHDATDVAPSATRCVQLTGTHGIPAGATGLALNVTAAAASGPGHAVVFPDTRGDGTTPAPGTSTVNYEAGRDVANATFIALPDSGRLCYVSRGPSSVRLVLDVTGYTAPDAGFVLGTPTRVLDTRQSAPVAPRTVRTAQISGRARVPATATAAIVNVTVTGATDPGHLRMFAHGTSLPNTSVINYVPGAEKANSTVVTLSADGKVDLYSDTTAPVQVILDVVGYVATGGDYTGITPARLVDTRPGSGVSTTLGGTLSADRVYSFEPRGGAVPADATAVILNVTAIDPAGPGHLRVYPGPAGTPAPMVSTVNYVPGRAIPNMVVVALEPGTVVNMTSVGAASDVAVDVVGYIRAAR